jgi:hypothetical protein
LRVSGLAEKICPSMLVRMWFKDEAGLGDSTSKVPK